MANEGIDQLARRLAEALPQGLRNMREDLEQNFRGILKTGLVRLDLVTREEFEVQESVLARTRQKLDALEERLASLEVPPSRSDANGSKKKTKDEEESEEKSQPQKSCKNAQKAPGQILATEPK